MRVLPLAEDDISERGTYSRLIPYLRESTTTPDDCFHALWEGANGIAAGAEPASDVDADDTWITGRDHRAILADPILIAVSAKGPESSARQSAWPVRC